MLLEAVTPFTYQWPGGSIRLEPGKPVEFDDERARRVLERAGHRARVVQPPPSPPALQPGRLVYWESPLFGPCSAKVLIPPAGRMVLIQHPVLERPTFIPLAWVSTEPKRSPSGTVPTALPESVAHWLQCWRDLAVMTGEIVKEDLRYGRIVEGLAHCDAAFHAKDWSAFKEAAERVRQVVTEKTGGQ